MPRPPKRKASEIDYDDPLAFVADYCRRRDISYQIGQSHAEKECIRLSSEAREEFKSRRDAAGPGGSGDTALATSDDVDRKGLSPAQKYMIRLQNNRKSANASKVFNEVLKREQAACLENLSTLQAAKDLKQKCSRCRELPSQEMVASLQAEIDLLKNQLRDERLGHEKTRKRLSTPRHPAPPLHDMHGPTRQSSQETPNQENSSSSSLQEAPSPKRLPSRQKASATKSEHILDVYRRAAEVQHISTGTIDGSQQENIPHISSQENVTRFHAPKITHHPYSMSLSQSDMKDMQVGVNLTQSQTEHHEELDEKGQLTRNMPRSGGIPVAMLDSQPSQSDVPGVKFSIGSEELNFSGPECVVGSQGIVEGGTPKKARLE